MQLVVSVLGYGDHPGLLARCLTGIWNASDLPEYVAQVRLFLNAPSARMLDTAQRMIPLSPVPVLLQSRRDNPGKYGRMREAIYGVSGEYAPARAHADGFVWFDDDSFIRPQETAGFFGWVATELEAHDLLGSTYHIPLGGHQADWIRQQPWYTGKPFMPHGHAWQQVEFLQGAFWAARLECLERWQYPFPELYHNGGDVMLGALAYQRDFRVRWHHKTPSQKVAINADEAGRESRAARRGLSTRPVGWE